MALDQLLSHTVDSVLGNAPTSGATNGGASAGANSNGGSTNAAAGQSASQSLSGDQHDVSSHQASDPTLKFNSGDIEHKFEANSGGDYGHDHGSFGGISGFSAEASNPSVSDYDSSHGSFDFNQSQQTGTGDSGDHGLLSGLG